MTERPGLLDTLLRLCGIFPIRRDHAHIDSRQWIDQAPAGGYIVTRCRICGAFIGRRRVAKRGKRGGKAPKGR